MKKRFLIWDNPKDAIISLTLLLMLVGCINVFSASFVEARDMFEDGYYYLKRYLIFGCSWPDADAVAGISRAFV